MAFAAGRLGLLGWVGVALVAGAAAYALVVVPQRAAALAACRAETGDWEQRRQALAASDKETPAAAPAPPTVATTPAALQALDGIARQDKLTVSRSEYRYSAPEPAAQGGKHAAAEGGWLEVRIQVPATGSYGNVRAFLAHALDGLPTLALDEALLRRESIAGGDVHAQLRFTLFVRAAGP